MDLEEAHADVEAEAPVCGEGHHTGVDEELVVAVVEEGDVLLDLRGDVAQRFVGQGGGVTVAEVLLDAEDSVAPQPFIWSRRAQLHLLRIRGVELTHEGEHRIPRRGDHMGEYRVAGRVGGEDHRSLGELGPVLGVDVDHGGAPLAGRCRDRLLGRFDVGAVAVPVLEEREREAGDQVGLGRGLRVRVIESACHRGTSRVPPSAARETHGMMASPADFSSALR